MYSGIESSFSIEISREKKKKNQRDVCLLDRK